VAASAKGHDHVPKRKRRVSGVRRREQRAALPPVAAEQPAKNQTHEIAGKSSQRAEPAAESHRPPEWLEPSISEDAAIIERLLEQTSYRVSCMAESTLTRGLKLLVKQYRRLLDEWQLQTPTPEQRVMLLETVEAFHDRVVEQSLREPGK
jgi:hypothetical protein